MKVLLIDNGTTLLEKLERLIPEAKTIEQAARFSPTEGNDYDLVVLSGSSREQLVGNESDFQNEINFVRTTKRPVIGICFGCELIVSAFGGKLRELATPSKGIKEIEIVRSDLFGGQKKATVYESHRWVMDNVPDGFEVLARSVDGPEIIRYKTLPLYGIQFHPENFIDSTEGDSLFLSLMAQIK